MTQQVEIVAGHLWQDGQQLVLAPRLAIAADNAADNARADAGAGLLDQLAVRSEDESAVVWRAANGRGPTVRGAETPSAKWIRVVDRGVVLRNRNQAEAI